MCRKNVRGSCKNVLITLFAKKWLPPRPWRKEGHAHASLVGNVLTPQIEVTCVFISETHLPVSFNTEQKVAATMKISALSVLALATNASAFVSNTVSSRFESRLFERRPYITGNWKLNPSTRDEAVALAKGIADSVTPDSPCDVALFVPFPFIEAAQDAAGDKLTVGAEVSFYSMPNDAFARILFQLTSCILSLSRW